MHVLNITSVYVLLLDMTLRLKTKTSAGEIPTPDKLQCTLDSGLMALLAPMQ